MNNFNNLYTKHSWADTRFFFRPIFLRCDSKDSVSTINFLKQLIDLKSLLTRKRYRKITQYKSEILEALYSVKERLENFDPQHWNLNCPRGLVLDRH